MSAILANPFYTFLIGLGVGLWAAVNVWIWRYAVGYQAGVKYCLEAIEPLRVELAAVMGELPVHRVTEEMRLKLEAELGIEETRH